jgi:hypothetical protein
LKFILRNAIVAQLTYAEQIMEATLAQAAALNTVHEINNECSKNPIMIYADEGIYDNQVDLYDA